MQKVNVASIIQSHLRTLRSKNDHICIVDLSTFYFFPAVIGVLIYITQIQVPEKVFELSISVFSIFAALLLSVQVALYSVSLREETPPEDTRKLQEFSRQQDLKKSLLKELNDNVSYLILLSVFTVTITLIIFFFCQPRIIGSALATSMYIHFFMTLIMVIKRASIVFSREYD